VASFGRAAASAATATATATRVTKRARVYASSKHLAASNLEAAQGTQLEAGRAPQQAQLAEENLRQEIGELRKLMQEQMLEHGRQLKQFAEQATRSTLWNPGVRGSPDGLEERRKPGRQAKRTPLRRGKSYLSQWEVNNATSGQLRAWHLELFGEVTTSQNTKWLKHKLTGGK